MDWFPWLAIPIKNIYYFHFIGFTMKWSYQVPSVLLFATLKNHLVSDFHGKPRSNCFCLLHSKWNSLISINFSVEEVFFFRPWVIHGHLLTTFLNFQQHPHACTPHLGVISLQGSHQCCLQGQYCFFSPAQWYVKILAVPCLFFSPQH